VSSVRAATLRHVRAYTMGAQGMSKSEVSRMAAVLDSQVEAFRKRTLEGEFAYVWLDGMYLKVREGGRIVSKAVLVAFGVNGDGQREVLGVQVTQGEMETCWRSFLASLLERGLRGVKLVISDAHAGLRKAIGSVLNGTTWQRCYVHFCATSAPTCRKLLRGSRWRPSATPSSRPPSSTPRTR
jgi:transposase-like protein